MGSSTLCDEVAYWVEAERLQADLVPGFGDWLVKV